MLNRKLIFTVLGLTALLGFVMAGCGKRDENAAVNPGYCAPGQYCPNGGFPGGYPGGVPGGTTGPATYGPVYSTLDFNGSYVVLTINVSSSVAVGQAQMSGTLNLAPGTCGAIQGMSMPIQGNSSFVPNYGGAIGQIAGGFLSGPYGGIQLGSLLLKFGSGNPALSGGRGSGFYLEGAFNIVGCGSFTGG